MENDLKKSKKARRERAGEVLDKVGEKIVKSLAILFILFGCVMFVRQIPMSVAAREHVLYQKRAFSGGWEVTSCCEEDYRITIQYSFGGYSVTTIAKRAFYDCSRIREIYLPESIEKIKDYAFGYCKSLVKILYGGTKEEWRKIRKDEGWDEGTGDYIVHCTDGELTKKEA